MPRAWSRDLEPRPDQAEPLARRRPAVGPRAQDRLDREEVRVGPGLGGRGSRPAEGARQGTLFSGSSSSAEKTRSRSSTMRKRS